MRYSNIVLVFYSINILRLTDGFEDERCIYDSMQHRSYKAMDLFTRIDGAFRNVIAKALLVDLNIYRDYCEKTLISGMKIKENYVRDLECSAKKEISYNGNMAIDKYLTVLKYWCGFGNEMKNAFFKIDTLHCFKDIKKEYGSCVGHSHWKSKFSKRDFCSNKDTNIFYSCILNTLKKCTEKASSNVKYIMSDILSYSKTNLLCGKEHLLWKYSEVMNTIEYL